MASFRYVGLLASGFVRNVTDLAWAESGRRIVLVGATHAGGGMSLWNVTTPGAQAGLLASHAYPDALLHRTEPQAVVLNRPGGAVSVLPAGLVRGQDYVRFIGEDGRAWAPDRVAAVAPLPGDLLDAGAFRDWRGGSHMFVTQAGRPWFSVWSQTADGRLVSTDSSIVPAGLPGGSQIDSIAHARIGAVDLLLSSSIRGNFISAHRLLPDGSLSAGEFYVMARGAGFNGPRDVAAVQVEGHHFLIVSSAGSSSLTTVRFLPGGGLVPVDHVIDELTTRFQSATVMQTATVDGRVFIVAGGADDGLSLFTLTPDGRLIHLDSLADKNGMSLANVSALAMRVVAGHLVLFAASATEAGISQLVVPVGAIGVTRHVREGAHGGTEAGDLIQGGAGTTLLDGRGGDDILIAGAGVSAMMGGRGADIFIPTADSTRVIIRDFEVGVDRLDLSMMGMIRSVAMVSLVPFAHGIRIRMGGHVIELRSSSGKPIPRGLFDDSLFPIAHYQPPDVRTTIVGTWRPELLSAARGGSTVIAGPGSDTVLGSQLEDRLLGDQGHDRVFGNDGDDSIWGGRGMDYLRGGALNDLIYGGYDNDTILGEAGDDLLLGQDANDLLWGGGGGRPAERRLGQGSDVRRCRR